MATSSFVDIHCHLLPAIDDGSSDMEESLAMARMAVADGITTVIATPHQLGTFGSTQGDDIRRRAVELQRRLDEARVPLRVLPGADVRIEADMVERLVGGDVLTLADRRCHVLLELPHELYLPLDRLLADLSRRHVVGILSHPERNQGILRQPDVLGPLVDAGCLMQITAASLCGTFGPECQQLAEWMLAHGLVHFVATDAHGSQKRRPLMRRAFDRVVELTSAEIGAELCGHNPACVANGQPIRPGRRPASQRRGWWGRRSAA
jgi:protein-tyrosine phosphatase